MLDPNFLFWMALVIFVVSIGIFLHMVWNSLDAGTKRRKEQTLFKRTFLFRSPLVVLLVGIVLAMCCMGASQAIGGVIQTDTPVTHVALTILQSFTINREISAPSLEGTAITIPSILYFGLDNALYIGAAFTTLGTIAILVFKALYIYTLGITSRRFDVYVFSRANEPSLTLANSIVEHYAQPDRANESKRCQILFADAKLEDDRMLDAVKDAGFVYIDTPVDNVVARCKCFETTTLHVILSSQNETENLHEGIEITRVLDKICKKNSPKNRPTLHLFSSMSSAESYVDEMARISKVAINCPKPRTPDSRQSPDVLKARKAQRPAAETEVVYHPDIVIRRIDWVRNVMFNIVLACPLFLSSPITGSHKPADLESLYGGTSKHIVIVGAGHMGYEFLKGIIWCATFENMHTRIDVIDSAADAVKDHLMSDAPELFDEGTQEAPDLNFYSMDVQSTAFLDYLNNNDGITYMLFSLGDDLVNTETARRARELLEYNRLCARTDANTLRQGPFIAVVVDDPTLASSMRRIQNSREQEYELTPVGDLNSIYSYDNVYLPELESMARRLNYAYNDYFEQDPNDENDRLKRTATEIKGDASYDLFEYNRRSSRASAAFLKYHLYSFCCRAYRSKDAAILPIAALPSAHDWTKSLADPCFANVIEHYNAYIESDAHRLHFMKLEHRRWNAYMRTDGFRLYDRSTYERHQGKMGTKNQLARLHVCLVPFDDLQAVNEMVESIGGGGNPSYERSDERIIQHLGEIARAEQSSGR